jgi:hypothetical protein
LLLFFEMNSISKEKNVSGKNSSSPLCAMNCLMDAKCRRNCFRFRRKKEKKFFSDFFFDDEELPSLREHNSRKCQPWLFTIDDISIFRALNISLGKKKF